ncbi:MAG TPA: family 16 glycosylhydrolase [Polyangiales bacterium]
MRNTVSLVGVLAVMWTCQVGRAYAVPPAPVFAANYQNVFVQDFSTLPTLSVSAQGPCGAGGTTWMSHKPRGGEWFAFSDPLGTLQPFAIANGALVIRVQKNSTNAGNPYGGYTGGLLSSVDHQGRGFAQKYGYFEASMQFPGGPNTWPAFWLLSRGWLTTNATTVAEIDVTESTGNGNSGPGNVPPGNPNFHSMTWHRWSNTGSGELASGAKVIDASKPPYSTNLTTSFHSYGVDVEPTGINWYFDRQLVWTSPIYPEASEELFVLVDLALGNGSFNNAAGTGYDWALTPDPSDLKVAYIAVWASPNSPNYAPTNAPDVPTGLTAIAQDGRISLNWNPSSGATSYRLYRDTTAGGPSPTLLATVATPSFNDTSISEGSRYYYRVAAVNGVGISGLSSEASATPIPVDGAPYRDSFARMGELNGSTPEVTSNARTWTSTTGNGQFLVDGNTALISNTSYPYNAAFLPVNGSSGVVLDGSASFTLSALVSAGSKGVVGISLNNAMGSYSNMYSANLASVGTTAGYLSAYSFGSSTFYDYSPAPTMPTQLSLKYDASTATLTYSVGTKVVRKQSGVGPAQISALRAISIGNQGYGSGATGPQQPRFDDFKLLVARTEPVPEAPSAPTSISASAGDAQVALTWTASVGATNYDIYRSTTPLGQGSTPLTSVTGTSYTDLGLSNGTTYYYRVVARNAVGSSGFSGEAAATPTVRAPSGVPYQDGFTRVKDLNGSPPDTTTNMQKWTVSTGNGQFLSNGSAVVVSTTSYPYNAAYLAVNGNSGVVLDGTTSFTLSALVSPGSKGIAGIALNNAMTANANMYSGSLATLGTTTGYLSASTFSTGATSYNYGKPPAAPTLLQLKYDAGAGSLDYSVGATVVRRQTGVTAAQIAALRAISIGNHGFGNGTGATSPEPRFDDFKLAIGN